MIATFALATADLIDRLPSAVDWVAIYLHFAAVVTATAIGLLLLALAEIGARPR